MELQRGTWRDDIENDFLGYDPPNETVYTGISSFYYCLCFMGLHILQTLALFIMKWNGSKDFKNANFLEKILHTAESTNFAYSMYDWDFKRSGGPNEHYARMKEGRLEIIWNIVINLIANCVLITPLT